ncbi:MAG: hypothetical protein JNK32_14125 [Anaerolineales bacterium]|nr:hypothetical protein [Anaerolineales bacterium]
MSESFSSISALGRLKSQHFISKRSRKTLTILGIGWAILLCFDIAISISVFFTSYQETNDPLGALLVPLICIGMFMLPGVLILYQQWWAGVHGVAFYELGLAVLNRRGITEIPWQNITSLRLEWNQVGNPRYSSSRILTYVFTTQSGETFRLGGNLEGFDEFEEKFYKPASEMLPKKTEDNQ